VPVHNRTLFRREAIEGRAASRLGPVRIHRTPASSLVAAVAAAFTLATIAFIALGEVTRKINAPGIAVPVGGLLSVSAAAAGEVTQILVKEGQALRLGQPVANIRSDVSTSAGATFAEIERQISERLSALANEQKLVARQYKERSTARDQRINSLLREANAAALEAATAAKRADLLRRELQRTAKLLDSGYLSQASLEATEERLLEAETRELISKRTAMSLEREIEAMRNEQTTAELEKQSQILQISRSSSSLQQELAENKTRIGVSARSPVEGRVATVLVSQGQRVSYGQNLALVAPLGAQGNTIDIEIQLFIPSRAAGFVSPGQEVYLRYAAFPYQKFGMQFGKVSSVSSAPISPSDLPAGYPTSLLSANQSQEPLYRIIVQPVSQTITVYDRFAEIPVGATVDAMIVQERKSILKWIVDPLMAASGVDWLLQSKNGYRP
jgi:membrane fusion protein